jgi:hypothetical protein
VLDGGHRAGDAQDGKDQERHNARDQEVDRHVCP